MFYEEAFSTCGFYGTRILNVETSLDPSRTRTTKPIVNFDKVAQIYDETRDKPTEAEVQVLTEELTGSAGVLDLPVGTGRLAKPLQDRGIKITGLDISNKMLTLAKAKRINILVRSEATHLPFRDKSFDAILTIHFLHLITEWGPFLREVSRITSGKLVSIDSRHAGGTAGMRRFYLDAVKTQGFTPPTDVEGELKLARLIKPRKIRLIETTKETRSMQMLLEMFEKRWTAVTWGVPDDFHMKAVQALREEFQRRDSAFRYESFLLVWTIEDLKGLNTIASDRISRALV